MRQAVAVAGIIEVPLEATRRRVPCIQAPIGTDPKYSSVILKYCADAVSADA